MQIDKNKVIEYINNLKGFRGYVQFSHRELDIAKDIFIDKDPSISPEEGFIYEAHFANKDEYITIKQLNNSWVIDRDFLKNSEEQEYYGIGGIKVIMAQIWEDAEDKLCEDMPVKKLKKVVFAGFKKGGK